MVRIECEYDIDHTNKVFVDEDVAAEWVANNEILQSIARGEDQPFMAFIEELLANDMLSFVELEVIENV